MNIELSFMLVGAVAYFLGYAIGTYVRKRNYKKQPIATLYIDPAQKLIRMEWNISIDDIPKDADAVLMDVERIHMN